VTTVQVETILCEIQAPLNDKAQWVHLFTHGPMMARDGRRFVLSDPAAVVERTMARAGSAYLPVDYEHQTDYARANGQPAPAAGWIDQLAVRDNGIWGRVEWTAKARAMLSAREYRYISPTFTADKETCEVRVILRAALTNAPALELTALASVQPSISGDDSMPLPKEITAALGLTETASVDDALTAIRALSGTSPELASTLAAMADVVNQLNELRRSSGSRNVSAKVDTAIKSGAFPPALREWATELCSTNEALFDTFLAKTGRPYGHLTTTAEHDFSVLERAGAQPLGSVETMIASQLGLDPAALKG
jgi:phage I-like protein